MLGGLGVETKVIIQKEKLHMNNLQVACGINVDPHTKQTNKQKPHLHQPTLVSL